MTQRGFPFDAGEGLAYELDWSRMARQWLSTGVFESIANYLAVFADSSGMQVKIPSGEAWIRGHYYINDAQIIQAIAASDPTNPRIDRIVLRIDYNANTIRIAVLQGVPAGSPAVPALTQNDSIYEFPLARVAVGAGVGLIIAGNITDERVFARHVIATNAITALELGPNSVNTSELVDAAVTESKIGTNQVTETKIAGQAVNTAQLKDASVSTVKIIDANVTTAKIADNAVTGPKIPTNAIGTSHITDGSVTAVKLAAGVGGMTLSDAYAFA